MKADKRAPGILADDRPHRMGAIGQISGLHSTSLIARLSTLRFPMAGPVLHQVVTLEPAAA